jgi:large subunit ribosomal protein L29
MPRSSECKLAAAENTLKETVMELDKIRSLSDEELKAEETKAAEQLFRIRFAKSLGKQEGAGKIKALKLDIARIKTVARERVIAAAGGK